ncbi:hypothetical protein FRB97_008452 [Tulasnella sp. 331]|nr:hypothetical protein FRB98_008390 [Tulasnella sp. 332]KAG8882249.1 hypothetical protein FRB97_008452 [Tulasnella sp. 331]
MPHYGASQRTVILVVSIIVALSGGTNYVYSAYAPQLGHKLGLNHAQLNMIGFGGNAGNYICGPIWGKVVDRRGPRLAFGLSFIGYLTVRMFYDGIISLSTDTLSTLTPLVVTLTLFEFMTGSGGNACITAALNTSARCFPAHSRATVTGLVASGFGLSAFLFSTIAHVAFPGNTSDFLLILALGTSITPLLATYFLRRVPDEEPKVPDASESAAPAVWETVDYDDEPSETNRSGRATDAEMPLLSNARSPPRRQRVLSMISISSTRMKPTRPESILMSGSPERHHNRSVTEELHFVAERLADVPPELPVAPDEPILHPPNETHGLALFKAGDFWLIFSILLLLSGTGLMYINNAGSIAQALYLKEHNGQRDEEAESKWQAAQVSVTSVTNCLGRVIVGISADWAHNRWGSPRVYFATAVSTLFLISQVFLFNTTQVDRLWRASAALGLAYGGMFGLLPVITYEWFGLKHYSENWGYVSVAPVIAGNIFSLAFGKNLDSHASTPSASGFHQSTPSPSTLFVRGGLPSELLCYQGRECYIDSLQMTISACIGAILLSIYAGWLDRRRLAAKAIAASHVHWAEDEVSDEPDR